MVDDSRFIMLFMKRSFTGWLFVALCSLLCISSLECKAQKLAGLDSSIVNQRASVGIEVNDTTLTVSGVSIPLDKIPLHSSYTLPVANLKENENFDSLPVQKWVYASENKKKIAIVTDINTEDYTLELFDSDGKFKWKTITRGCYPSFLYLSDDGRFTHVLCRAEFDNGDISNRLLTYDQNGVEINRVDSVAVVRIGSLNHILHYVQYENLSSFNTRNILYSIDFSKNKRWKVNINSLENMNFNISASGNSAICTSGNKIYSIDDKGKIIWEKSFSFNERAGLSTNGEFFYRIEGFKLLEVYRNSNLKLVTRLDYKDIAIMDACFVNNSIIALSLNSAPQQCSIGFYNLDGQQLDRVSSECYGLDMEAREAANGVYHIYVGGIMAMDYKTK